MNLIKIISSTVNSLNQRVVKFFRFGKDDVQTALEYSPYGLDSNPIKDMIALYSPTTDNGETAIIGYLNKNQKAGPGEFRTFCTDVNGAEKFYTWLKADGTLEIGGNTDNMVRFSKLELAFNQLKSDFNNHITAYNLHVHTGGTISGSTGITTPGAVSAADISLAKIDEIKTL